MVIHQGGSVPELPEVETVVRDLRPQLVGRMLTRLRVGDRSLRVPWQRRWRSQLVGRRVVAVQRRAKWIVLELNDSRRLLVHLGMTGQLTVVAADAPTPDHLHFVADLDEGAFQLRFRDVRRFGSIQLFPDDAAVRKHFETIGLGPEPFDLEPEAWRRALAGTRRCVKATLLDQTIAAGVGNIYADESLHEAQIHPARLACDLTPAEAERLRLAVVTVLQRAIDRRGATIRDYVGGSGLMGGYQDEFRVYGREGEPCPRCRQVVRKTRLAGRASHFCPNCQRTPLA
jgi:formamidopyrimidine-DNA glycosylase